MTSKVALVTGGARRVGAAICRCLHARGLDVAIHCRFSLNDAQALAAELESARPASTAIVVADLLDTDAMTRLVDRVLHRFGRLDCLVNNASTFYPTPIGGTTAAQWTDLFGTNLKAPFFLSQAAQPALAAAGGAIVNIVDIHADRPMDGYSVYSAAKAGLVTLTRALAREMGPAVRVNAVAPGAIMWPETGEWDHEAVRAPIIESTPLERIGTPEDIAGAVAFLLLDAPFVTGQVLAVDGGRSIVL